MSEQEGLSELLDTIAAVQRLLSRFEDAGMIIGGVAAGLLGRPRLTADVDALVTVSMDRLNDFLGAAAEEGLLPRIRNAEEFARRHRVLLLRHEASGIGVDISFGLLPFEEEAVSRSMLAHLGSLSVRIPTAEDLVILKAVAHRSRDLEDVEAIIDSHPDLDRGRIRRWVKDFAETLELPELWDDIAGWLES